jgi:uncharacterized protein (DUF2147 family)
MALVCIGWTAPHASAGDAALGPVGVWATDGNDSHVKIEKCGINLCGTIVWLKDPLGDDGKPAVDFKNPDPGLRSRPLIGLMLLSGFVQDSDDPDVWTDGRIYDPDDGRTYSCKLTVQDANSLRVRGYIGFSFLGETQVWTRVTGQ